MPNLRLGEKLTHSSKRAPNGEAQRDFDFGAEGIKLGYPSDDGGHCWVIIEISFIRAIKADSLSMGINGCWPLKCGYSIFEDRSLWATNLI